MTDFQPKPQTPEEVADGLRDAMRQAKEDGVFDKPKPPTLYDALYAEGRMHSFICDTVCEIVKKWLPDEVEYEENELGYNQGWNDCLEEIREKLR